MSYHKINEPFEERGKVYVAKEFAGHLNPCNRCAFGHPITNEDAEMCNSKHCEVRRRKDGLNVIFVEVKS